MYDLLIKNVNIVKNDKIIFGSVAILNEKIADIIPGSYTVLAAKNIIEGNNNYLFPGVIDSHVHFNDPGYTWREDFIHGSKAAAIGGVTTVIDMPLQNEPALANRNIFQKKKNHLINKSYIDYGFWGALVKYNLSDIEELDKCGVLALKCFFAPVSPDYTPLNSGEIRQALSIIKKFNGVAAFHCEDYSIITFEQTKAMEENRLTALDFLKSRPISAELISVKTIIELAKELDARVHICHISHPLVAEEIKKAKEAGVKITCETCPHYLLFNENYLIERGSIFKCAPPLRDESSRKKLFDYIIDGTIDIISSDHSPCSVSEKDNTNFFKAWGGISGVQNAFQLLINEALVNRKISLSLLSRIFSYNAAEIFGLNKFKGQIEIGYDADLVLVDLNMPWEITNDSLEYLNKFSAFSGLKGTGMPVCTILRGNIINNYGHFICSNPTGQLITKY